MKKIAICQPEIIKGGRLSVILNMAKALNEVGIIPDIISSKFDFSLKDIEKLNGKRIKVRLINFHCTLKRGISPDLHILLFNHKLKSIASEYNCIINHSNSVACLPTQTKVLSYVHFSRKARLRAKQSSIHMPESSWKSFSIIGIQRLFLLAFYKNIDSVHSNHTIVTNSEFTKNI